MDIKNVFVLGLDELNAETLNALPHAEEYRFHQLLTPDELRTQDIQLRHLLAAAERQLYRFEGTIDAIIGYWDFPVSSLVPILCQRFGTIGPGLEAVVKCEHKYWSRLEQRQVIDECPGFGLVDPQKATTPPPHLEYPLWVKPVKSAGSTLAYHVHDQHEFQRAMRLLRDGVGWLGEPFQYILDHLHAPAGIAASGQGCLVEEAVSGTQVTVEGYVQHGAVHVYGVVGSVGYPGRESFLRFQYPAALPANVTERLTQVTTRVIGHIGLDHSTFNIEFFWNEENDTLTLLEINPRHSQSHARLFQMVDGVPNHHAMVSLALGRDPALPRGNGRYRIATKWFLRRFSDARVRRAPTAEEVARVEADVPGTMIHPVAQQDQLLSALPRQDSYSYQLADLYIGAETEDELIDKYERCVAALPYELEDTADTDVENVH
ncbi:ATP-grasp domain-containing protein [Phytoactinopolyspora halophila]|uniref:ATP-grasp domain-containing protein n=1 Tax=Phytoactinopolyspora halophila TaxID=1981511 RepID=UPI001B8B27F1|nr:ATP-grasp domain-containing protein [Phytoactinopolyspora halophila]